MSEEFGSDFITITDEEGNNFELELLDTMDFEGETYSAFLPANMDEDDPDYGIIILKIIEENGEELFGSVDDEDELQRVYEHFMEILFADEEDGCCCGCDHEDGCCCGEEEEHHHGCCCGDDHCCDND